MAPVGHKAGVKSPPFSWYGFDPVIFFSFGSFYRQTERERLNMLKEILIAGFGGQGIMLMGQLLAYGGIYEGLEVSFFPSYGPEMRGGTANCTVVLSDERIKQLEETYPHILLVNLVRQRLEHDRLSAEPLVRTDHLDQGFNTKAVRVEGNGRRPGQHGVVLPVAVAVMR